MFVLKSYKYTGGIKLSSSIKLTAVKERRFFTIPTLMDVALRSPEAEQNPQYSDWNAT